MNRKELKNIIDEVINKFFENEKGDLYDPATNEFAPGPRSRPEYWVKGKYDPEKKDKTGHDKPVDKKDKKV